jgi:ERCC4-related helicase
VFPVTPGFEPREYQLAIVRRALFENTMVSLPTGLGKTFIAAVVMANYFRWGLEGSPVQISIPSGLHW